MTRAAAAMAADAVRASALEVRELEAGYGGQQIVRGVSLHVAPGELVALIGPNGAGKSTLLNAIVGLLPPRAGHVLVGGREITRIAPERTLEMGVAYVPQVGNVFPSLTVAETLEVCFRRRRADLARAREEVLELFPRLRTRLGVRAGLLSGGERQMLAIARAIINRPFDVLLTDEPSAALSVGNVRAIFDRLRWIRDSGIAILLVEQNAQKALEISDRAYVMEAGRIALEGPARELLGSDDVRRHYLGIQA